MPAAVDRNPSGEHSERPPEQPPEETVWSRYSPRNEAPLSTAGSFALHALVIGVLLLVGLVMSLLGITNRKSEPVEPVQIVRGDGKAPGAVGNPGGPERKVEKEDVRKNPDRVESSVDPREKLSPDRIAAIPANLRKNPEFAVHIAEGSPNLEIFARLGDKIRLPDPPASGVKDGQGGQGGQDGQGGDPKGKLSKREKRMLRWTMLFDTSTGESYVQQLHALGAILGIPKRAEGVDYYLVRQLGQRPAQLLDEDFTKLGRIQWTDGNPKSAVDVARALQIRFPITHFIAFMPEELEQKLAKLEKGFKGLEEDQIFETRFQVRRLGSGYEPVVVFQRAK